MGIFSRRNLYQILTGNARFVRQRPLSEHIRRLNGGDQILTVTTEWEASALNALSKLGTVSHEPKVPGTSKPDVLFTHAIGAALMDITSASDRGLDQQNAIDKLSNQLVDSVTKRGLDSGHFGLQVKGNWRDLTIGGPKAQLSIPRPRDFDSAIFNDQFDEYLNHIETSPEVRRDFSGAGPDVEMTISYNPTQKYFSVNHLSYTVPFSATQNTVYAALEAKANQLKSSQFTGLKGVLLCDGGCAVMSPRAQKGQGLDATDIISTFLSNYRAVDFVLAILIDGDSSGLSGPDHLRVITKAYVLRADNPAMPLVGYLNERLALNLPNPENIPINAYGLENEGKTFNGRWSYGRSVNQDVFSCCYEFTVGPNEPRGFHARQSTCEGEVRAGSSGVPHAEGSKNRKLPATGR